MINVDKMTEKKILIVDDEREILDLLETVLLKEGFRNILKASSGLEAVRICQEQNPDIIVLDIMLPDFDGYEVCKKIRQFTIVPIIFLSAKSDDIDKLLGLGIGGDDYVTKPFSPKEVAYRVKAHLRRSAYIGQIQKNEEPIQISFGNIQINQKTGEVKKNGKLINLTAKEYQLLLFLAKHPNQILSKRKISDAVWGEDYFGYDNTIMVHIRHLREKIEDDPGNPKYIKTVKGLGYKLFTRGD
jgi:DNA-binding response OmpR family regulator